MLGISAVTHQTKVVGTARRSELERTLGSFLLQSFHYIDEEPESQTEKGRNPTRGGISVLNPSLLSRLGDLSHS